MCVNDESSMQALDNYHVENLNPNMGYFFQFGKVLYEGHTKFQKIEVLESEQFGRVLRLDNVFQTSEWDEFLYHEPLVHVPSITHGAPENALVIGGGDGGAIREFLKYPSLKTVTMIELDEEVVDVSRKYIPSISDGAFESKKLKLAFEDGIAFIKKSPEKYDVIMLDLTDPFGPSIELYTKEFYTIISDHLTPKGILSLHIESPISRPHLFSRLYWTLKSVFPIVRPMTNYVPMYGTLWGYGTASHASDPLALTKEEISRRLSQHGIENLRYYNPSTHFGLLSLPGYLEKRLETPAQIIRSGEVLIDRTSNPGTWNICFTPEEGK